MKFQRSPKVIRNGFTLIELLVVIAIGATFVGAVSSFRSESGAQKLQSLQCIVRSGGSGGC